MIKRVDFFYLFNIYIINNKKFPEINVGSKQDYMFSGSNFLNNVKIKISV